MHKMETGPRRSGAAGAIQPVDFRLLLRAAGVQSVGVIDPFEPQAAASAFEEGLASAGVSVVVVRHPCPRYAE